MDIVFTSVPFTDTTAPLMAPALLKSQAQAAGYSAVAMDLNAEIREQILKTNHRAQVLEFYKQGRLDPMVADQIEQQFVIMTEKILTHQPQVVALSLFTYDCQWAARWLAWHLRRAQPHLDIVLGGAGLFENLTGETHLGKELQAAGIINSWIRGDGEQTIVDYLDNKKDQIGIMTDNWQQHTNSFLNQMPPPDYSDYKWDLYASNVAVPVLGSRGCVRDCTFCDIHVHWPRYSWRTGDSIFEEIKQVYDQYGRTRFRFQDSLINGNMREYKRLCELLAKHNNTHQDRITWDSFFILRPQSQFGETDWQLTHESGAENLFIGVESLDEHSRYHIGKKFSNQDLEFGLEQMQKWNSIKPMKATLLFLIGYITETEEHIKKACQWWLDHAQYKDIIQVNLGTPLGILRNTPLHKRFDELGLRWVGPNDTDWANNNSEPTQRARWYRQLSEAVKQAGIHEVKGLDNHYILERIENGKFDEYKHKI